MLNSEYSEGLFNALQGRFFGKYRGIVHDNEDSLKRGRLSVLVPSVLGTEAIWALPCVPYAGPKVGFYSLPPVGAGVWVEFEGGNINHPIWVGCYWGDQDIEAADTSPAVKFWQTDSVTIRIDDDEGTLTLETKDGTVLTIGAGEIKLDAKEINHMAGGGSLKLSASGLDVNNGAFSVS